jgi:hypothetical protein
MLDKIKYINSRGTVIDLTKPPFIANESQLRDYEWNVESVNDKITGFNMSGVKQKELPITVSGTADEINRLFEEFEIDVLTNSAGKLYINDYYLSCFVTASTVSDYTHNDGFMTKKLKISYDYGFWCREAKKLFNHRTEIAGGYDFSYDFPFDYGNSMSIDSLENDGITACDFEIVISGAVISPQITIGGNSYGVSTEVMSEEFLIINSKTRKIQRLLEDGTFVNEFKNRERSSDVFKKIPTGVNPVIFDDVEKFEVTLFLERSAPKWI